MNKHCKAVGDAWKALCEADGVEPGQQEGAYARLADTFDGFWVFCRIGGKLYQGSISPGELIADDAIIADMLRDTLKSLHEMHDCIIRNERYIGETVQGEDALWTVASRANRLSDECGTLRAELDELLRENAVLRRKVEKLERSSQKGKVRR